jgi:hypothetical protein
MSKDAIVLTGVKETLKALEAFDKEAVRNFNKVLNNELGSAKTEAQSLVSDTPPLSGWSTQPAANPRSRNGAGWPAWDQSVIKSGISMTKAEGRVRRDYTTNAGALKNKSAAGVIYEVAGRKNKSAGKNKFISNLSSKDNPFMPSRLIWHVVDKNRSRIIENVSKAFDDVKSKLQKNLEKERG